MAVKPETPTTVKDVVGYVVAGLILLIPALALTAGWAWRLFRFGAGW